MADLGKSVIDPKTCIYTYNSNGEVKNERTNQAIIINNNHVNVS